MLSPVTAMIVGDGLIAEAVRNELQAEGHRVYHARPDANSAKAWRDAATGALGSGDLRVLVVTGEGSDPHEGASARRALALVHQFTDALAASGAGRVVLCGSRDWLGWPGRAERAADQAGLVGLTRSLALELGPLGISVNLICASDPEDAHAATDDDPWARPPGPLTGPVEASDVAFAVSFAANPASGYFTGQVLHVSGGLSILSSLTA